MNAQESRDAKPRPSENIISPTNSCVCVRFIHAIGMFPCIGPDLFAPLMIKVGSPCASSAHAARRLEHHCVTSVQTHALPTRKSGTLATGENLLQLALVLNLTMWWAICVHCFPQQRCDIVHHHSVADLMLSRPSSVLELASSVVVGCPEDDSCQPPFWHRTPECPNTR